MTRGFSVLGAVTAPGTRINEDAYAIWPGPEARAAWVLDGVTGINDHPLLPGPTDAAWFVAQVQEILPRLLAAGSDVPTETLLGRLIGELRATQERSWRDGMSGDHGETPAASFTLARRIGDEIEIARLGDCPVLLETHDGRVHLLDDAILAEIEADLKRQILAHRARGVHEAATLFQEMRPALRAIRQRRNQAGGYGVLSAEQNSIGLLQRDRFPAKDIRHLLLLSDGYYRLVDVYGHDSNESLLQQTIAQGPAENLARLRRIEAEDPTGVKHPRLKMADDATALLLAVD
ncbi:protein phosphatase 2C domain-containing protein [Dongia rigui]|uniref:Protein phosphatase 2C domain-containing protein n=1 Tax=Dongia rigui TaxID=940149 RepID=A0ABU5DZH4_9PROT|nr:protein phosphatase 2C domain-containing protein [Dongia rigui]MDY0872679.1 protein phosphatase 2C domain-containing protein [Dongia rigui]